MSHLSIFQRLAELATAGEAFVLVTIIATEGSSPRHTGTRMIIRRDGSVEGTIGGGRLEEEVRARAKEVFASGEPVRHSYRLGADLAMCCGGGVEVLIEPVGNEPRLLLFGGGHVARPLARFAAQVGFRVSVVDGRPGFASRDHFPEAADLHAEDPCDAVDLLAPGPGDYVIIATHEHALDEAVLRRLVACDLAYLGLIGSFPKVARFRARLRAAGVADEQFARANAPMGFDIGAETPAEIAVAVVAELIRRRRRGSQEGAAAVMAELPRGSRSAAS
jgi:xanthine dehydrogenase accessory factor